MVKALEKIAKGILPITVGTAISISEPGVLISSVVKPIISSESFRDWLKNKNEDIKRVREMVRESNISIKSRYFAGRIFGYVTYGILGYGVFKIINEFGN